MKLTSERVAHGIGFARIGAGLGAWLAPATTSRLLGLDPERSPQLAYLARAVGIRDLAIGAGVIVSDREAKPYWVAAGIACDASDVFATVWGALRGELPRAPAVALTAGALAFVAAGAKAIER